MDTDLMQPWLTLMEGHTCPRPHSNTQQEITNTTSKQLLQGVDSKTSRHATATTPSDTVRRTPWSDGTRLDTFLLQQM